MQVLFQGSHLNASRRALNKAMYRVHAIVEWIFTEIKLYWTNLDWKRKMRISESPIGALYLTAMLLTNMRSCVYANTVSQFVK